MADSETNTNTAPVNTPEASGAGTPGAGGPGGGTRTGDPAVGGDGGDQGNGGPAGGDQAAAGNNGGDDEPAKSIEEAGKDVDTNAAKATQPLERDPDAPREVIRSDLARGLLWLLTITIGAVIFFVGLGQVPSDVLTQSIFPSLVTLTGTALGFYFGAQTAKKD